MRVLLLLIFYLYLAKGFSPRKSKVYYSADDGDDPGQPLILTPYIEAGKIKEARHLSFVGEPFTLHRPSHAGFLTVNPEYNSNLFFWYFPASSPSNRTAAPPAVVLWLQGGPGASSLFGLFIEHGPFRVNKVNGTYSLLHRKHSWAQHHHVIYIDSPVGSGFSFTEDLRGFAKDEVQVAQDLYTALIQLYQMFPELLPLNLKIAGESYAGKYIPALGIKIHETNPTAAVKLNLEAMYIGNGWCFPYFQLKYSTFSEATAMFDDNLATTVRGIEWRIQWHIDHENLLPANRELQVMLDYCVSNVYPDIYNLMNDTQIEEPHYFVNYINNNTIRRAIHVGNARFDEISKTVYQHLKANIMDSVEKLIYRLIISNYKIAFYSGMLDSMVPFISTEKVLQFISIYTDPDLYSGAVRKPVLHMQPDGSGYKVVGYTKRAGNLVETVFKEAGHMVPRDIPEYSSMILEQTNW